MKKRSFFDICPLDLQMFAEKTAEQIAAEKAAEEAKLAAEKLAKEEAKKEAKKIADEELDSRFEKFGVGLMDKISGLFPKKEEEEPKKKKTEEDGSLNVDDLVEQKLMKRDSERSFSSFTKEIGEVEGVNKDVFKGLNSDQYSAIKGLIKNKNTLSEEEMKNKINEKAAELAKKIVADNKDDKKTKVDYTFKDLKKY